MTPSVRVSIKSLPTLIVVAVVFTVAVIVVRSLLGGRPEVDPKSIGDIPVYTYRIISMYPHDPGAFTQGLVFADGILYESTGLEGQSTLRSVELETGSVVRKMALPDHVFGEGLAVYGDRIVQLTFTSEVGYVYDRNTFAHLGEFTYHGQGWGITYDGARLIMSDGTSDLRMLDAQTFEETGRISVFAGTRSLEGLNELEYIDGEIYANIWPTDIIAVISPGTGQVTRFIDLTGLLRSRPPDDRFRVLNGIAHDAEHDRLFVTGKRWPYLYEIEMIPFAG